jgi:hypothetical protein
VLISETGAQIELSVGRISCSINCQIGNTDDSKSLRQACLSQKHCPELAGAN